MNTTGLRGFLPSWSTIRSTEETALQEICWLLLNYCRYGRYTVVVISIYLLQSWLDSVNAWPIYSYSICCLNITDADHSVTFPPTCLWFFIFLSFPITFFHNPLSYLSALLLRGNFDRFLMMMKRSEGLLLLSMTLLCLRSRCNKQNTFPSLILLFVFHSCLSDFILFAIAVLLLFLFYKAW